MKRKDRQIGFRMSREQYAKLKAIADARDIPVSQLIRETYNAAADRKLGKPERN